VLSTKYFLTTPLSLGYSTGKDYPYYPIKLYPLLELKCLMSVIVDMSAGVMSVFSIVIGGHLELPDARF